VKRRHIASGPAEGERAREREKILAKGIKERQGLISTGKDIQCARLGWGWAGLVAPCNSTVGGWPMSTVVSCSVCLIHSFHS
jgi:hypothetical protein